MCGWFAHYLPKAFDYEIVRMYEPYMYFYLGATRFVHSHEIVRVRTVAVHLGA